MMDELPTESYGCDLYREVIVPRNCGRAGGAGSRYRGPSAAMSAPTAARASAGFDS